MLLVIADQAHYHSRPSQYMVEDIAREHDTKEFKIAIVKAHDFLGISSLGGIPMQAICGASLFDEILIDEDSQFGLAGTESGLIPQDPLSIQ